MSHIKLAKVLRRTNLLQNVFGASPYLINVDSKEPEQMVLVTKFSKWAPVLLFVACVTILTIGSFIQYTVDVDSLQSGIPGIEFSEGSVSLIIMQMTIFSTFLNYVFSNLLTVLRRQNFRNCLVSILTLVREFEQTYHKPYDPRGLAVGHWFALIFLPTYFLLYFFYFDAFIFNASESYYLVPLGFMIENITSAMTAVDICAPIHILGDFFDMFAKVPQCQMDEQFFTHFTTTINLFETIGQNHGYRECFSIGNEFFVVLSQTFYTLYGMSQTKGPINPRIIYMAIGGILPRAGKVIYVALRGSVAMHSVSIRFVGK